MESEPHKPLSQDDVEEGAQAPSSSSSKLTVGNILIASTTVIITAGFFAVLGGVLYEVVEACLDWGREIGNWVTGE